MSNRWPGGLINKTPVTPTGPYQDGTAPGMWSLADAAYWSKQGLWPIAGNFLAVEDVFSTYLYTGNGSTQTITNGIDLSGKGGLVWLKDRNSGFSLSHGLTDTERGFNKLLSSNTTSAEVTLTNLCITGFNSDGFGLGTNSNWNNNGTAYASWTFREAPGFFDIVTYTGNGATARTISHSLGSKPGAVIVKRTDSTGDWYYRHEDWGNNTYALLNTAAAYTTLSGIWGGVNDSSSFYVGGSTSTNINGATYVAYLFAHDTSSTGFIQCGSFTTDSGGNFSVTLGYEPQWVLVKRTDGSQNWFVADTMRGFSQSQFATLNPNTATAEAANISNYIAPNATGFGSIGNQFLSGSATYIYIAIRRGPMRTPTTGTSVFAPVYASGTAPTYVTNFVTDMAINRAPSSPSNNDIASRLTGTGNLATESTAAESTNAANVWSYMNGWRTGSRTGYISWNFRRAPSFMDVVCYSGQNTTKDVNHNLGVVPELIIIKNRGSSTQNWAVYSSPTGINAGMLLNATDEAQAARDYWSSAPTSTTFSVISADIVNSTGNNYVAYLFATCPGVSKVGSYTGTGTTQTIDCGFTTGARFVLIKRTNGAGGDWYVWDSARGIVAGNDPYLLLNSTAAEVTNTDYVDTDNSGFQISSTAPAGINANGGTFIYLAIS